jgi:hypothetical protein
VLRWIGSDMVEYMSLVLGAVVIIGGVIFIAHAFD